MIFDLGFNFTRHTGRITDNQLLVTFMTSAVSQKLDQENGPVLFLSKLTIFKGDGSAHYQSLLTQGCHQLHSRHNYLPLYSEI